MSGFVGVRGIAVRLRDNINWPMEQAASYVWTTILSYLAVVVYTKSDSFHVYFEEDTRTLRLERGKDADEASAEEWHKAARNVVATFTFLLSVPFLVGSGFLYGWVTFTDPTFSMLLASLVPLAILGVLPHTALKMLTEAKVHHPEMEAS